MLEKYAPPFLAEEWDNIGLQVGDPNQRISGILMTLDLNDAVLKEAESLGVEMVVVHHTPFFKAQKDLRVDRPVGRLLAGLVKRDMAMYAAHTNLDVVCGGVNDVLAEALGLKEISVLETNWEQNFFKLVVFVPREHTDRVAKSILEAGAGYIGSYADCSFRTTGIGTFRPLTGTNPFIGKPGELERVEEDRLETIVPEERKEEVIQAMLEAHPYEEVAYDLYPLVNRGEKAGLGRVGRLPAPMSLLELACLVKTRLHIDNLRYCGDKDLLIEKVAVCGGSGISLYRRAAACGAQVIITADVKYHEAQEVLECGMVLIDAGHFATERPVMDSLAGYLTDNLTNEGVRVHVSQINTDPFCFL